MLVFVAAPDVSMRGDVVEQMYEQLLCIGHVPRLDIFLHSAGGQTEIPWRLITLIRDFADQFAVLIPGIAHSAATHLAMGADEIVMGPLSELSPVDPSRSHPLLPRGPNQELIPAVSVQDLRQCVEFVKKEIGDESPESMAAVFVKLFEEVHPLAIGAIQQSYDLARLISRKALSTHMDPADDKEQIDKIVQAFSDEFYSHGYRIGWREAKQTGLKVVKADDELWKLVSALYAHYRDYFGRAMPSAGSQEISRPIVWLDSAYQRRILEEIYAGPAGRPGEKVPPERKGARWLVTAWEAEPERAEES